MEIAEIRSRRSSMAGITLATVGGLSLIIGALMVVLPLAELVGVTLPRGYQIVVTVFAILGGGLHLLAGWFAWTRRDLFWTAFITLAGMVILQVSLPVDVIALGLMYFGRDEFQGEAA